jgi:hypothetical protein
MFSFCACVIYFFVFNRNYGTMTVASVVPNGFVYATYISGLSPPALSLDNFGTIIANMTGAVSLVATFELNCPFNNYGLVSVTAGKLSMTVAGTHNGVFSHSSGAFILFNGGAQTLTTTSTINDGVGITFAAGSINIYGSFVPQFFTATGSAVIRFYALFSSLVPLSISGSTNLCFGGVGTNRLYSLTVSGNADVSFLSGFAFLK